MYMYVYVCVCIYIYIYAYTYTYTQARLAYPVVLRHLDRQLRPLPGGENCLFVVFPARATHDVRCFSVGFY